MAGSVQKAVEPGVALPDGLPNGAENRLRVGERVVDVLGGKEEPRRGRVDVGHILDRPEEIRLPLLDGPVSPASEVDVFLDRLGNEEYLETLDPVCDDGLLV